ncbi:hypothetical protein Tco_0630031 [Tanacetum coccineum]
MQKPQAAKSDYWKIPICDDDDDNDYTIAITPVLSTEEPVNSLIMENEHLDTISATESDEFIKSSVEILVPIPSESKGVPKVCDVPFSMTFLRPLDISKDLSEDTDTLREKIVECQSSCAKSKALKDNIPFHLPSDFHEEFADELAQIISQPEYDCFFKDEPELGNFTMDVVGNIFQKREPRVHVLNVLPTLELDFIPSSESIFAYVVWIFLPFLFIPVIPPYLLSCGDEDTIFDPGISKDCPDCEDSQFCHSSRVSHPQLHLGIRYPNLID